MNATGGWPWHHVSSCSSAARNANAVLRARGLRCAGLRLMAASRVDLRRNRIRDLLIVVKRVRNMPCPPRAAHWQLCPSNSLCDMYTRSSRDTHLDHATTL